MIIFALGRFSLSYCGLARARERERVISLHISFALFNVLVERKNEKKKNEETASGAIYYRESVYLVCCAARGLYRGVCFFFFQTIDESRAANIILPQITGFGLYTLLSLSLSSTLRLPPPYYKLQLCFVRRVRVCFSTLCS